MRNLLLIGLVFLSLGTFAQKKVNIDQLTKELQSSQSGEGKVQMVWWIPVEFWEETYKQDNSLTEEQKEEFLSVMEDFTIVAILKGEIGAFGAATYVPEPVIRRSLYARSTKIAKPLLPIPEADIEIEVQVLLSVFRPVFQNLVGPMGENMHLYVFENYSDDGEKLFDPTVKGEVSFHFTGGEGVYQTPLPSLIEDKKCPIDGAPHNGTWTYCPFHGAKLE